MGFFAFVGFFSYQKLSQIETESILTEFKRIVESEAATIEREFTINIETLRAIKGLFIGSSHVTYDEFSHVAADILAVHDQIQALEWIPVINQEMRDDFEADLKLQFKRSMITERNPQGKMIRAKARDKYYPVFYVFPLEGNSKAIGYDLGSNPKRLRAITRAILSGNISITASILLVQDENERKGFLAILPIFKGPHNTKAERSRYISGLAVGVYFLEDVINSVLISNRHPNIHLELIEQKNMKEKLHVCTHVSSLSKSLKYEFKYTRPLNIAGNRSFSILAVPTKHFVDSNKNLVPELILLVAFLSCLFMIYYVVIKEKRTIIIQNQVNLQTEELRKSELKWKFALEGAKQGVWDWNIEKNTILFSAQCRSMLGYKASASITTIRHYRGILHPDDINKHFAQVKKHLSGNTNRFFSEHRIKKKDGTYMWVMDVGKIIETSENGRPTRIIGTLTDITARKKYEIERERLLKKLDKANKKLTEISLTDALTGISNRRHFNKVYETEWERARRHSRNISIIMIDIDFFKAYNDHYGHQKGDECLKKVALLIKQNVTRTGDLVARYGGEEFVVIMPDTNGEAAEVVAEKCRNSVAKARIQHEYSTQANVITISMGIASLIPSEDDNQYSMIKCADEALYSAKGKGRNQVVSCTPCKDKLASYDI